MRLISCLSCGGYFLESLGGRATSMMRRALVTGPLLARPLRPLLARLPLAAAQSRMAKSSGFDLSRPVVGPRPKRAWKLHGFSMDVDFEAVKALLKERDAARSEAQLTGDYSVVDALLEQLRRWQTWPLWHYGQRALLAPQPHPLPPPPHPSALRTHTTLVSLTRRLARFSAQAARQRAQCELARRPALLDCGARPSALVRRGRQAAQTRDAAPDDGGARHRAEGGAREAKGTGPGGRRLLLDAAAQGVSLGLSAAHASSACKAAGLPRTLRFPGSLAAAYTEKNAPANSSEVLFEVRRCGCSVVV